MHTRARGFFVVMACFGTFLAIAAAAGAADYEWSNPGGGTFDIAGNWTPAAVPGPADTAIFDLSSAGYTVTLTGSVVNDRLVVRDDIVTVNLGGAYSYLLLASGPDQSVVVGEFDGDAGHLTITNGPLGSFIGNLGVFPGASGQVTVDGAGARWDLMDYLLVGDAGSGQLTVSGGGVVTTAAQCAIARGSGTSSQANVTGAGSLLDIDGDLAVGQDGHGTLSIASGGQVDANTVYLAWNGAAGAQGEVTVSGGGSSLNAMELRVGRDGEGTMTVSAGGYASCTGWTRVGGTIAGDGDLTVTGVGTSADFTGGLYVGAEGVGTMTISDGAAVNSAAAETQIGCSAGALGVVNVTGAGTTWNTGSFRVGSSGDGFLNVANAGKVVSPASRIGRNSGSNGMATVTGAGSWWEVTSWLGVATGDGGASRGDLYVLGGGKVTVAEYMRIGEYSGADGYVMVADAGSSLEVATNLYVGTDPGSVGELEVLDGGRATCQWVYVGHQDTASGTVVVDGAGAELTCTGNAHVGNSGNGLLEIRDGGAVECNWFYAGLGSTGFGAITVSGTGSALTADGELILADNGGAMMSLSNGGHASGEFVFIARQPGGNATVTVSGLGSQLTATNSLFPSQGGTGQLNILDGGVVMAPYAHIGTQNASAGGVTVSGAGSRLEVGGDLNIGDNVCAVSLAVDDDGLAFVGGWVRIRTNSSVTLAGGTLSASNVQMEGGTLSGFGHVDANISGGSLIRATGGTLTLGGAVTSVNFAGTAEVESDATLELLAGGKALLGPLTTLTNGVLIARNDIELDPGDDVAGYGVIVGQFMPPPPGPLSIEMPSGTVELTCDLDVGMNLATVYSVGPARLGTRTTLAAGAIVAPAGIIVGADRRLVGNGIIWDTTMLESGLMIADVSGTLHVDDSLAGYGVLIGNVTAAAFDIATPTGTVVLSEDLDLGDRTAEVFSIGSAVFGATTTLAGGAILAPCGIALPDGALLTGHGTVAGKVAGAATARISLDGNMTLGDPVEPDGFWVESFFDVFMHTAHLESDGPAGLGQRTTLAGGTIVAGGDLDVGDGDEVSGYGTLDADVWLTNGRLVASTGQSLAVTGDLSGYGITIGQINAAGMPIASTPTGTVLIDQPLSLGSRTANVYSDGPAVVDSTLSLAGGTVNAAGGLHLTGASYLRGCGLVNAAITGDPIADLWTENGQLTVGDPGNPNAIAYGGRICVYSDATLELLDADDAEVDDVTLENGVFIARNGATVAPGAVLAGYGVVVLGTGLPNAWDTRLPDPAGTVSLTRPLNVGADCATVYSAGQATFGDVAVSGGQLLCTPGIFLPTETCLSGHGTITGNVVCDSAVLNAADGSSIDVVGDVTGCGVVIGTVTATGSMMADPSGRVELERDLDVGGRNAAVYSAGMAKVACTVTLGGGVLSAADGLILGDTDGAAGGIAGHGTVNACIHGTAFSTITASGGPLTLGDASSMAGFQTAGRLEVNGQTVTVRSDSYAPLGVETTLAGGTLQAAWGVALGEGDNLIGFGTVSAKIAAGFGSIIDANGGDLALGDPTALDGFFSDGELETANHTVTLHDANRAVLGSLTVFGDGSGPGTLTAANGLLLEFGKNIVGYGVVNGDLLTNGYVLGEGLAPADGLEFTGLVTGVGDFAGNVTFSGGYSPGLSPTAVDFAGNVTFAPTSTLTIELGGTAAGSQYDQLNVAGNAALDGTLAIALIDGFAPAVGDEFNILTYGTTSGAFASVTGNRLANLALVPDDRPSALTLVAAYYGDADLNGQVALADLSSLAFHWQTLSGATWGMGDFDGDGAVMLSDLSTLAFYWGSGMADAPAVPEPATMLLLALAGPMTLRRRRRA